MKLSEPLLMELQHEAANTKKYFEIIPVEHLTWKPHPKSMDLGTLAGHIAELPGWLHYTINAEELDFAKLNYTAPVIANLESLLKLYQDNLDLGSNSLGNASNETLMEKWKLRNGEHIFFELPKIIVIRNMVLNHIVHHRGQLSVYLRTLNVKIPGLYGPSADEMEHMA